MQKSRILILTSIGLLIFSAILAFMSWWPKMQEYSRQANVLSKAQEDLKTKNEYYSNLKNIDSSLAEYEDSLLKIESAYPENIEEGLAAFTNFIYGAGAESGTLVNNVSWQINEDKNHPNLRIGVFAVSGQGGYGAIKKFIDKMYKNSRLVDIKSISITSGELQQNFNMDLAVNFFSANPVSAASPTIEIK